MRSTKHYLPRACSSGGGGCCATPTGQQQATILQKPVTGSHKYPLYRAI